MKEQSCWSVRETYQTQRENLHSARRANLQRIPERLKPATKPNCRCRRRHRTLLVFETSHPEAFASFQFRFLTWHFWNSRTYCTWYEDEIIRGGMMSEWTKTRVAGHRVKALINALEGPLGVWSAEKSLQAAQASGLSIGYPGAVWTKRFRAHPPWPSATNFVLCLEIPLYSHLNFCRILGVKKSVVALRIRAYYPSHSIHVI